MHRPQNHSITVSIHSYLLHPLFSERSYFTNGCLAKRRPNKSKWETLCKFVPKTLWKWPALQIKPHCLEVKCLNFPQRSFPGPTRQSAVPAILARVSGFIGAVPNAVIVVTEPANSSHPLGLPVLTQRPSQRGT